VDALVQARPVLASRHGAVPEPEPPAPAWRPSGLDHLAALHLRYCSEEAVMLSELGVLRARLDGASRDLWLHYLAGLVAPSQLRERCDALLAEVEGREQDLRDLRAAIRGVGEEIAAAIDPRERELVASGVVDDPSA
jgi:hypothetical protein